MAELFSKCLAYYPDSISIDKIKKGIYDNLCCLAVKPMDASNMIGETLKYLNSNNIIMNSEWLNLCIGVLLQEEFCKKYEIVENSEVDAEKVEDDVFKIYYLNYIAYCETHDVFPELKTYMKDMKQYFGKFRKYIAFFPPPPVW